MTIRQTRHRLLTTTAALSVAFGSIAPLPIMAQDAPGATTPPPVVAPPADAPETVTPDTGTSEAPPAEADTDAPEAEEPAPPAPAAEPEAPQEPQVAPEAPAAEEPTAPPAATEATPEIAPDGTPPEIAPVAPDPAVPEAPITDPTPAPEAPSATPETSPSDAAPEPNAAPEPEAPAPGEEPSEPASTEPSAQAVDVLDTILGGAGLGAAAGAAASDAPDSDATEATTTQITDENARSSAEDFTTTASGEQRSERRDRGGLSDLQKAGLLALGGLTVGALLSNGNEVVSNTGDRVVVRQNDGNYTVLKDDDALLRQPGSTVRTENFTDGSTRSTVEYADGSRVVTVRDASGRVLRRERIDPVGQQVQLFDDTAQAAPVDTSILPRARDDIRVAPSDRAGLREALSRIEARAYSLSQIRDYRQVRALAPVVDVDNITFRSGSAAVDTSQAEQLSDLGNLMRDMIAEKPTEVFLIEGHTDATGSASSNLALSDRRAESVALALTEYFDVPPENLIVQGYGESDLRIDTQQDEPRNRRVAVRIITPLLQTAQAR